MKSSTKDKLQLYNLWTIPIWAFFSFCISLHFPAFAEPFDNQQASYWGVGTIDDPFAIAWNGLEEIEGANIEGANVVDTKELDQNSGNPFILTLAVGNSDPIEYVFDPSNYDKKHYRNVENLNHRSQEVFLRTRSSILRKVAEILHFSRLVFGAGALVKNKIKQLLSLEENSQSVHPLDAVLNSGDHSSDRRSDQNRSRVNLHGDSEGRQRVVGAQIVGGILQTLDRELWRQSSIIVKNSQLSFTMSIGVLAMFSTGVKSIGGSESIGFAIGFNRETNIMYFEIYRLAERIQGPTPAPFIVGILPKIGFEVVGNSNEVGTKSQWGMTQSPAFLPTYLLRFDNGLGVGATSYSFALPPVVGDMAATRTETLRRRLVVREIPLPRRFLPIKPKRPPQCQAVVGATKS